LSHPVGKGHDWPSPQSPAWTRDVPTGKARDDH
jgi:hypothetical protein